MASYQNLVVTKNFTANSYGTNTELGMKCLYLVLFLRKLSAIY